jgi:hypothetical protein
MKINKPGIWISAIYSLIQLFLVNATIVPWMSILSIYLVIPSVYLLEFLGFGSRIDYTTLVWLSIATVFQIYAVCHFVGYLYRKKF